MKIPKKIILAGVEYKIKFSKSEGYGGRFDCGKQVVHIGNKAKPDYRFQVFIHEILEVILTERCYRYAINDSKDNEHFLFNFTHDDFDNICKDLAFALKDL